MSFPEEKIGDWTPLDRKLGEWTTPMDRKAGEWTTPQDRKMGDWTLDRFGTPWRDIRTMEWVLQASQQKGGVGGGGECRGANTVYCGQDCGDGFCYNVWNSMVHV